MYTDILLRFGELSLKGKNKSLFIKKIINNIDFLIDEKCEFGFDRLFLKYSLKTLNNLKYIFGLYSYSPVIKIKSDLTIIKKKILELLNFYKIKNTTFKIVTNRHWKNFSPSSMQINKELGEYVIQNSLNMIVNLKNPQYKIEVEIRKEASYIFYKRFNGLGGYPVGINGKVLHLISGGIDSPVAAYEMMKRGVHVDYVSFISPPHTDEKTVLKILQIVKLLNKYQGKSKVYFFNYTKLMNLIGLTSNQSYKINLMRRSFYRIVEKLALKKHYLGIASGDNLGQVASQTLESILTIQKNMQLPIYRPLLTRDKIETILQAQKIGTYNLSIQKANETCELFAPDKPIIKPKFEIALTLEKELNDLKIQEENINFIIEQF